MEIIKFIKSFTIVSIIFTAIKMHSEPVANDLNYWEKVKQYFNSENDNKDGKSDTQSKEDSTNKDDQGLTKDTLDWLKSDIKNIGAWEYKILQLTLIEPVEIETKLNLFGQEKWECFWIKENGNQLTMLFKRPKLSYMKSLPVKDLLKLMSLTNDGEGE